MPHISFVGEDANEHKKGEMKGEKMLLLNLWSIQAVVHVEPFQTVEEAVTHVTCCTSCNLDNRAYFAQ